MSRGKKTNPLSAPNNRKAAFKPTSDIGYIINVEPLPFTPSFKSLAQKDVSDIIHTHLKNEAIEFKAAANEWLLWREEGKRYDHLQDSLMHKHGFSWPYITKEMVIAIASSRGKPQPQLLSYTGANCYANPWVYSSSVNFVNLFHNALMYGPVGEGVSASLLLPALQKHIQLYKKFYNADKDLNPNQHYNNLIALEQLSGILETLQRDGSFALNDLVALRKDMRFNDYGNNGYLPVWEDVLEKKWQAAAKDILERAKDLKAQRNTHQGLQLMLSFVSQSGVPFETIVHDELLNPSWTASK